MKTIFEELLGFDPFKPRSNQFKVDHASETGDATVLSVELPGYAPEDISVEVDPDNYLIITASKNGKQGYRQEFLIPGVLNADQVKAECHHGLLTVTIPRRDAKSATRKIPVNV